ncbi:MAG: 6-phosphogluconolactonase [Gammaproteobacteria bacterium CG_4_10_14_0_8_um_filter_38_16]|nr:MAG: 6-phosphogluconolactonase [Gammaproteobacteria bacterium CG_4_10_14_0_8_um_filter_38_16]PJA02818.1 MAG: 6-phosphogluconolactonase [Gammaproteobacteria bacterium CG_4_10_14_0_2_um_filter_38_22]PJB09658.1 MAG: 6-phosphogluconolactonase [Gammaproteobacteria bacterium CG_4_9_14_3_um_filter_38_9]
MDTVKRGNEIFLFSSSNDLFQFAAKDFYHRAIHAVKEKGIFSVVLSGGNTPKLFFKQLTETECYLKNIPWQKIKFFFGDERYVPADNIESNYHTAYQYLFSKVSINPKNIYRIPTHFSNPKEAASSYEKKIRDAFQITDPAIIPSFDLIYLGLGDNAHTASIMPFCDVAKNALIKKNNTLVTSLFVQEYNQSRITLTPIIINNAHDIIFLVTGESKATAAHNVLEGKMDPLHYPAQFIHAINGKTTWCLDAAAARKLATR